MLYDACESECPSFLLKSLVQAHQLDKEVVLNELLQITKAAITGVSRYLLMQIMTNSYFENNLHWHIFC